VTTTSERLGDARKARSRALRARLPPCPGCHAQGGHVDVTVPAAEYNATVQSKIDGGMEARDAIRATPSSHRCPLDPENRR
jgi:hypothetical protein